MSIQRANDGVEWIEDKDSQTVTLVPVRCSRYELMTTWMTAQADSVVDLEDNR